MVVALMEPRPWERFFDTNLSLTNLGAHGPYRCVRQLFWVLPRFPYTFDRFKLASGLGILMRGAEAVRQAEGDLRKAMADKSPYVRITAAEALGRYGKESDLAAVLAVLVALAPADLNGAYVSMSALNALDSLGAKAKAAMPALQSMQVVDGKVDLKVQKYGGNIVKKLVKELA